MEFYTATGGTLTEQARIDQYGSLLVGTTTSPTTTTALGTISTPGTVQMGSSFLRNRIINGDMRIDQRNAGAAVNGNGGTQTFPVDRFYSQIYNTTGNTTGQQSSVAPADFTNSLKISVQTADSSLGSTDAVWYGQNIEGYNVADLNLGSATNARSFTLSFWVYSNVTGTYCICIKNSAENRAYVAEYTINASTTWEKKSITISGDTTGTWLTTNGTGMKVWFALMAGSSYQTTPNVWSAGTGGVFATSNQVNLLSSLSNYWQVTGVQLEVGSVATPFERRQYGQELALCQRYFQSTFNAGVAPAQNVSSSMVCFPVLPANTLTSYIFPVPMRVAPTTITTYNPFAANSSFRQTATPSTDIAVTPSAVSSNGIGYFSATIAISNSLLGNMTLSSEL